MKQMEKIIGLLTNTKSQILIIISLIILSSIVYFAMKNVPDYKVGDQASFVPSASHNAPEIDAEILKNALNLYIDKRAEGADLSDGPCLGKIAEDWVLDIAHRPRTAVDDLPENQCVDFREGRAHHFIELDPDGQLLRSF